MFTLLPNQINQLKKELYSRSLYEFVKAFWNYADPSVFIDSLLIEFYCEVFQYMSRAWYDYKHIEIDLEPYKNNGVIIDIRQNKNNLNLAVPPRHSKSMIFNVLAPVWLFTLAPIKAVSVSHTGELASSMNAKRQSVINSQLFKEIYSDIKIVENSKSFIKDNRGGELYSVNRNAFTGYGGDLIINDDLTNAETARKDKQEMENAWSYYRNTMPSRINDINKGIILNIQQRLAPNDITGKILNDRNLKKQYCFITLPAIFKETTHLVFPISGKVVSYQNGAYLWSERFNDYKKLKAQVGESVFETQYLQNPIASDSTIIKPQHINIKSINEIPNEDVADFILAGHDFAVEEKKTSDFLGSILAYKVNNTLYIKDCKEERMDITKGLNYVKNLSEKYHGIIQVIENKANGTPIMQQLKHEVRGLIPFNPKGSKSARLESAVLYMDGVIFVADEWDEENKKYELSKNLENLKKRLLNFPFVGHDDIVDAFAMLVLYVFMEQNKGVFNKSFNYKNIIKPDEYNNVNISVKHFFLNRNGNTFKVNQIGIDYTLNVLYILDEWEYTGDFNNFINEIINKFNDIKFIIDTSEINLNIFNKKIIFESYKVNDFKNSVNNLDYLFSNKNVKIFYKNKFTINDVESFKWIDSNNDEVKYQAQKEGFLKNIIVAIDFLGVYMS